MSESEKGFVVKLRGLPWSAKQEDIHKFFKDCGTIVSINFTCNREGRASGEAYVEFDDENDLAEVLKRNNQFIESRYIEVVQCKRAEMDYVVKKVGRTPNSNDDCVVRLRGIPYGCTSDEIEQFFTGIEIVPNGVYIPTDFNGLQSGDAFVTFPNNQLVDKALGNHMKEIGHRYIEVFRSSQAELNRSKKSDGQTVGGNFGGLGGVRKSPFHPGFMPPTVPFRGLPRHPRHMGSGPFNYVGFNNDFQMMRMFSYPGRGGFAGRFPPPPMFPPPPPVLNFRGMRKPITSFPLPMNRFSGNHHFGHHNNVSSGKLNTKHTVKMRGLPFDVSQEDIVSFFDPLKPTVVRLRHDRFGQPSGQAEVEFRTHNDAVEAMKKDREKIGHRYIELFLESIASEKLISSVEAKLAEVKLNDFASDDV